MEIRNYRSGDFDDIYKICFETIPDNSPIKGIHTHKEIIGHIFAGPYVSFEPELACILSQNDKAVGYIIGTADSKRFEKFCNDEWFPPLLKEFPKDLPGMNEIDKILLNILHSGYKLEEGLDYYPAHLHIDILPEGQGGGFGRKLMEAFLLKLKNINVEGVHLEVGKTNEGAVRFYEKTGFEVLVDKEFSLLMGLKI